MLVTPKVYLIGFSSIFPFGLRSYLEDTGQEGFLADWDDALEAGLSEAEILCSFYAKLCYRSLVTGYNANLTKTRDIASNVKATVAAGHGSVFEHVNMNFVVTNCSRVYTHEQARHRVGIALSQTSGRYVRGDSIDFVADPILDCIKDEVTAAVSAIEEAYMRMCDRSGINGFDAWATSYGIAGASHAHLEWTKFAESLGFDPGAPMPFELKKKITSALRRVLPNGQANEMGLTLNVRSIRHLLQLRTHPSSEWEIRAIYEQVYDLVRARWSTLFCDAQVDIVDGIKHVHGMRMQPYDTTDAEVVRSLSDEDLRAELSRRESAGF